MANKKISLLQAGSYFSMYFKKLNPDKLQLDPAVYKHQRIQYLSRYIENVNRK